MKKIYLISIVDHLFFISFIDKIITIINLGPFINNENIK